MVTRGSGAWRVSSAALAAFVLGPLGAHLGVLPPRIGAAGAWKVECSDTGICALHTYDAGQLHGFVLTGSETGRRTALAKELAA